ncbi:MAG: SIS domain-containing protein [Candidatus Aminicenantales bacterium]
MKYEAIVSKQASAMKAFFEKNQDELERSFAEVAARLEQGKKILVFGNGGSAAQAQHFASEMVNRFQKPRTGIPALSLASDPASLTSIANDTSFEEVFSRQIEALGSPGDVVLALSTSGKSPNVLQALKKAREKGLFTIALTGEAGVQEGNPVDILLAVPSMETPRIQEGHLLVLHLLAEEVEERLF